MENNEGMKRLGWDMGHAMRVNGVTYVEAEQWLDDEIDRKRSRDVSLMFRLAYANGFWAGFNNLNRTFPDVQPGPEKRDVYVLFPMKSSELHHVLDRSRVFTSLEAAQAAIPDADWVRDGSDHWLNINVDAERAFIVRKVLS